MLITNTEAYKTAARQITCTLKIDSLDYSKYIVDFTKEYAAPKGKFFGFLLPQTLKLKLRGNTENVSKDERIDITLAVGSTKVNLPWFYITECSYDRNQDITNIVALDRLGYLGNKKATGLTTSNVTLNDIILQICSLLGMIKKNNIPAAFNYEVTSLNVDGNETYNQYLTAIAEVTGCIGYISQNNELKFRQLEDTTVDTLTTSDYFEFSRGTAVTCRCVTSATELGNNISATDNPTTNAAMVQIIKENMFLTLLDENVILTRLQALYNLYKELIYTPYELKDRGYPGYEPGDQLGVTDPKGTTFIYLLDGKLEYNGGLKGTTSWETNDSVEEPGVNNITEAIKSTYAKVDKVNQRIDLVVKSVDEQGEEISSISIDMNGITSTVNDHDERLSKVEQTTNSITSTVQQQGDTLDDYGTKISQIEQTTSGITSTVAELDERITDQDQSIQDQNAKISTIEQTTDSITATVNDHGQTMTELEQTADSITSTVTSQGNMISQIRQDLDGINLSGYVTFTDLSTSGSTTINGSNITTGTINADRIKVGSLDADKINGSSWGSYNMGTSDSKLASLYVTKLYAMGNYSGTILLVNSSSSGTWNTDYTRLTKSGVNIVSGGTQQAYKSWADILSGTSSGTTAVFG